MEQAAWLVISLLCGVSPLLVFGAGMVWMMWRQ
jgi:hypothetical protein